MSQGYPSPLVAQYLETPPTLTDGQSVRLLVDDTGRLVVVTVPDGVNYVAVTGELDDALTQQPMEGGRAQVRITPLRALHTHPRTQSGSQAAFEYTDTYASDDGGHSIVTVRKDTPAATVSDGQYQPLISTSTGHLRAALDATVLGGYAYTTLDFDTGAGTVALPALGSVLAIPASGGPVPAGHASQPIRVDPTGTTTQPVSFSTPVSVTLDEPIAAEVDLVAWDGGPVPLKGVGSSTNGLRVAPPNDVEWPCADATVRLTSWIAGANPVTGVTMQASQRATLLGAYYENDAVANLGVTEDGKMFPLRVGLQRELITSLLVGSTTLVPWEADTDNGTPYVAPRIGGVDIDQTGGAMHVHVNNTPAVTVAGVSTFAEQQTQTTSLQLLDNAVRVGGAASSWALGNYGSVVLCHDTTDDSYRTPIVDNNGALIVSDNDVENAITSMRGVHDTTIPATNISLGVKGTALTPAAITEGRHSRLYSNLYGGLHVMLTSAGAQVGTTTAPLQVRLGDGTAQNTLRTVGSSKPIDVAIVDGSGNQISSFGGGTQYAHDATFVGGNTGTLALAVRDDVLAGLTSSDLDFEVLRVDSTGQLHVVNARLDLAVHQADELSNGNDLGLVILGTRTDTLTPQATSLGGYEPLQTDALGRLKVALASVIVDNDLNRGNQADSETAPGVLTCNQKGALFTQLSDGDGDTVAVSSSALHVHISDASVVCDTELPAQAILSDVLSAGMSTVHVGAAILGFDAGGGGTLLRLRCNTSGELKTEITNASLTVNTELPAAVALGVNTSNPIAPLVGACLMGFDGTAWDPVLVNGATGHLNVAIQSNATDYATQTTLATIANNVDQIEGYIDNLETLVTTIGTNTARAVIEDDTAFDLTGTHDYVNPIGALCDSVDPDSVEEGDVGIVRMSSDRVLLTRISTPTNVSVIPAAGGYGSITEALPIVLTVNNGGNLHVLSKGAQNKDNGLPISLPTDHFNATNKAIYVSLVDLSGVVGRDTEGNSLPVTTASDQEWAVDPAGPTTTHSAVNMTSTSETTSSSVDINMPRVCVYVTIAKTGAPTRFQLFLQWSDDDSTFYKMDIGPYAIWEYGATEVSGTIYRCFYVPACGRYLKTSIQASGTANGSNYFTTTVKVLGVNP